LLISILFNLVHLRQGAKGTLLVFRGGDLHLRHGVKHPLLVL
jgi:hypothetical protein